MSATGLDRAGANGKESWNRRHDPSLHGSAGKVELHWERRYQFEIGSKTAQRALGPRAAFGDEP